jgi:hypothetical protein
MRFLRLGIGSGRILHQPGGIYPDPSGADALMALVSNLNNYAVAVNAVPLGGTNVTLTGAQATCGVVQLTGTAAGQFTVTLPITPRLIDALGPTVRYDGTFAVPISVQNEDATNTAVLTAGDADTTLVGTMTVAGGTRRIWLLTLTGRNAVSILNIGTFGITSAPGPSSGTVTSVAMTVPPELTIVGSPVTGAGTLAVDKAVENANTVWAGPTSGGAAQPTFRALVPADLPPRLFQVTMMWNGVTSATLRTIDACFLVAGNIYTLPSGAANSRCIARTAFTNQTDFDLQKTGVSIGTIRFAAGGTIATYVGVSSTTFAGNTDDVRVIGPATPDATGANLTFNLYFSY